ncbi:hypothetical protein [Amycolatopsis vastitatis]|uniref:Uncharacterized protein n=1 Tax=Amycolatopsis vastitatis TaxID=1905142 RepID=A0A229SVJ2_9PSEU|nr:hypothetical protein [Amycolatopsis vastitatis]OXM62664.1 hypothetical protein CF165_33285 [Amycolatopsis vastitatis]
MLISKHVRTGVVVIAAGLALAGCAKASGTSAGGPNEAPAMVEQVPEGEIPAVTLTSDAAERIGLQTGTVREENVDGVPRKVVPYAALLYDPKGDAYVYATSAPLVFKRAKLVVDTITGDRVVLADGPPSGTTVVTVGASELFGAEVEIGE